MTRRSASILFAAIMIAACSAVAVIAAPELPSGFVDERVVGGLQEPVAMAFLPDGRLLVTGRPGSVRMIVNGVIAAVDPVLWVEEVQSDDWERGLLGIAIDPGWPARPYVYLFHTAFGSTSRLSRFRATGDLVAPASGNLTLDPASRYDVLRDIPDLEVNHNGGTLRFGLDGMLLLTLGEDGNECAAQDTSSLRGVLLRLDVSQLPDGPGGPPPRALLAAAGNPFETHAIPEARLVWAMGLRNPYTFHVDPADGSIYVADVGSWIVEEVDHVDGPGLNFGWPIEEGLTLRGGDCGITHPGPFTAPIHFYDRDGFVEGGASAIIGAGVYRGGTCATCRFPDDDLGDYFFGDFFEGFLRHIRRTGSTWSLAPAAPGQPNATDWARGLLYVTDYQFGADGALWYCRYFDGQNGNTGEIHRIVSNSIAGVPPAAGDRVWFAPARPQPASGRVLLSFSLPRASRVSLDVLDAAGRRIARPIAADVRAAGLNEVAWEGAGPGGRPAAPGIYFARLNVGGRDLTRRVVIVP